MRVDKRPHFTLYVSMQVRAGRIRRNRAELVHKFAIVAVSPHTRGNRAEHGWKQAELSRTCAGGATSTCYKCACCRRRMFRVEEVGREGG